MLWSRRTRVLALALLLAAAGHPAVATAQDDTGPIVVRNAYWAKPGLEEAVYRQRLLASEVRRRLGLYTGRVLRLASGPEGQPDVIWECEYPSAAARDEDVAALSASGEFDVVTERMGTLIERFERTVWRVAPGPEGEPEAGGGRRR